MKVGDYVRTECGKIVKVDGKKYYTNNGKTILFRAVANNNNETYKIIKSSPNIIDLIEVGDYVNGMPVLHKENDELVCGLLLRYKEENIENIVTKEQFESMEYEVK